MFTYMVKKLKETYKQNTVDCRYLEQPLISKRKSGPCLNLTSDNKILWIRGETDLSVRQQDKISFSLQLYEKMQ